MKDQLLTAFVAAMDILNFSAGSDVILLGIKKYVPQALEVV